MLSSKTRDQPSVFRKLLVGGRGDPAPQHPFILQYCVYSFQNLKIFALEQKATVLSFVKNVAFLFGHPVYILSIVIQK